MYSNLNLFRFFLIFVSWYFFTTSALAMEKDVGHSGLIEEYEIHSIADVLKFTRHLKNALVAVDWDDSIINEDGEDEGGLREGVATEKTVKEIQEENHFLVLTSRYRGHSLKQFAANKKYVTWLEQSPPKEHEIVDLLVRKADSMLDFYGLRPKNFTFVFPENNNNDGSRHECAELNDDWLKVLSPSSKDTSYFGEDTVLITPYVVFAGAHHRKKTKKGKTLAKLLDLHEIDAMFTHVGGFEHVVFVDNDYDHIQGMRKAFEHRPGHLILLYYPKKNTPRS